MPKVNMIVESISVDSVNTEQIVTMTLRYGGSENIAEEILQDEELTIEIPSHAPPPEGKK